jgi:sarcosine oxidase subunit gamma
MSEVASALPGAEYRGFVTIREAGPRGMITLRGDLAGEELRGAVKALMDLEVPERGRIVLSRRRAVAWMSPDELLLMLPHGQAAAGVAKLGRALAGTHHLAADVSDARVVFSLEGVGAREALAKLTPADLSPAAFGPGRIRRTRLSQVSAAFWMTGEEAFELVCFRSVAQYVFDLLSAAARPGSEVGHF